MFLLLTDREEQILTLMADGLTNKKISRSLAISEATVENHVHNIYVKLGISNRAQAVSYALQTIFAQQDRAMENRGNPS